MRILIIPVAKEIVKHFVKKLHPFIGIILLIVAGPQVILAQWSTNSKVNNAVCVLPGDQSNAMVTVDGTGGAIVAWGDFRNGNFALYVQRINAGGVTQWAANGVQICNIPNDMSDVTDKYRLMADGAGGAILIWHDLRAGSNRDVYGQRINASGVVQWAANGIAIAATGGDESLNGIVTDGAGGVIVTWTNGLGYAQRINSSGALQWGAAGQTVGTMAPNGSIIPVSDGAGGVIVVWEGVNSGLYAQRFNNAGNKQWAADGVTVYSAGGWDLSGVTTDGASGAIVLWSKLEPSKNVYYAQKINAAGIIQWAAAGVPVVTPSASTRNQGAGQLTTDMAGGAFITWVNAADQMAGEQVHVQRINQSGTAVLGSNGFHLSQITERQMTPAIVSDNSGGAIICWNDRRSGFSLWDIYAQRINASGTRLWPLQGLAVIEADENQEVPRLVSDGAGGAFFVGGWDFRNLAFPESDIYCQKVCANGTIGLCTVDPPKPDMQITGRLLNIANGDTTPSATDGTDFSDVNINTGLTMDFWIQNPSDAPLVLIETTITGPDSSSFQHGMLYGAVTIPPHDSDRIGVMFAPLTLGVKNATVSIITNVTDKNPYTFAVRGNSLVCPTIKFYTDADNDGYGDKLDWIEKPKCKPPVGFSENNLDCDDKNPAVHPGAIEICNGIDDDCDGQIDEGTSKTVFYRDADGDGYGNPSLTVSACIAPTAYVSNKTDCNDANDAIHPGAVELCNGIDDDCDGQIDEGASNTTYYRDTDGDGYGNPALTTSGCTAPTGYVNNNTDCNDAIAAIHPGTAEICNGVDDNCNGLIDEVAQNTFYRDADGDGYGNPALTTSGCTAPTGYVDNNTDCNDANPSIHPGALEICNIIDDDCDGLTDEVAQNTTVSTGNNVRSYFGYLPDQCITKTATVTNGVAPYSYFWTIDRPLLSNVVTANGDETMTGINSPTVEICLLDTANLCVTITDANGCTFTGCATVFASDVRCFADNSGGQKINICHESTTICINQNDLAEHLAHGDYIGACVAGFTMYPNPSPGELKLSLSLPDNTSSGEVQIVNSFGVIMQRIAVGQQQNIINITINQSGLYLVRLIVNKQTFTQQVTVIR